MHSISKRLTLIFNSEIESLQNNVERACWTGITDSETERVFRFESDKSIAYEKGKVSRIKDFGETPTEENDVKYTWQLGEPNHADATEDYVTLSKVSKFIDQVPTLLRNVLCEIPRKECDQSNYIVISIRN